MQQKEKINNQAKTTENKQTKKQNYEPSVQHFLLGMGMVSRHQLKF